MKTLLKRMSAGLLALFIVVSLLPMSISAAPSSTKIITTPTGYDEASDVNYVKNGKTYLRVYEFAGADGTVTLQGYRLHICDLLEQETGECFDETVSVTGRQIRTFRVEKK